MMKLVFRIESEPWTYNNADAYWCYEFYYDITGEE